MKLIKLLLIITVVVPLSANADMEIVRKSYQKKHFDITLIEIKQHLTSNAEAQYLMAKMYEQGDGIVKNPHRAIRWYVKSAESGYNDADYALGELFERGDLLSKNYSEARRWYRKGAESGHADSQMKLGLMLHEGRGGKRDSIEGLAWLDVARNSGLKMADTLLQANVKNLTAEQKSTLTQRKQQLLTTLKNKVTAKKGNTQ